jgi:hypothetical protein
MLFVLLSLSAFSFLQCECRRPTFRRAASAEASVNRSADLLSLVDRAGSGQHRNLRRTLSSWNRVKSGRNYWLSSSKCRPSYARVESVNYNTNLPSCAKRDWLYAAVVNEGRPWLRLQATYLSTFLDASQVFRRGEPADYYGESA